jgi:hypothetical protein
LLLLLWGACLYGMQQLWRAIQSMLSKQLQSIVNLHAHKAPQGSKQLQFLLPRDAVSHGITVMWIPTACVWKSVQTLLLLSTAHLLCISAAVAAA